MVPSRSREGTSRASHNGLFLRRSKPREETGCLKLVSVTDGGFNEFCVYPAVSSQLREVVTLHANWPVGSRYLAPATDRGEPAKYRGESHR